MASVSNSDKNGYSNTKYSEFHHQRLRFFPFLFFLVKVKELDSNLNYSLVGLRINTNLSLTVNHQS